MRKTVLALLCLFLTTGAATAPEGRARVADVRGEAVLLRDGREIPLATGARCKKGDRIRTGDDCRVDVEWGGLWGCRVLGSSQMEVRGTELADMGLSITRGDVLLKLAKLPAEAKFRLETPVAVASVRGTQFWGRVAGAGATFAVRAGEIEVAVKDQGTFLIGADQAIDVVPGITPLVRATTPAEAQTMRQAGDLPMGDEKEYRR